MTEKAVYSSILQDFASPLLSSEDTDEEFMKKMEIIEIIWNYSIAKKFRLLFFKDLEKLINQERERDIEMKAVLDMFMKVKEMEYGQYNNYITKMELRKKSDGNKTLYVESVDPLQIKTQ
jgi:archaellum biogenesis ATPase FlaH